MIVAVFVIRLLASSERGTRCLGGVLSKRDGQRFPQSASFCRVENVDRLDLMCVASESCNK